MDLTNANVAELQRLLTPKLTKYVPYDPTPKQRAFLLMNHVKEILYGGAAGGGKSVAQLMAALQFVDVPGYSAILFRKSYADLSMPGALIDVAKQWLMPFVKTGEVKWSDKDKKFTFPSSATLSFGYLEAANDKYNYQGSEFQYIGIDEATQIDPSNYRYMFSRLRKPKTLDVPLRFRPTTNPGGMYGEYYYQRFFVEGEEHGRVFIGADINDNPYLDGEEYKAALAELDPITREQLLNGNWTIKASGDVFEPSWFQTVPRDDVPKAARYVRYWDLASTDPSKRKNKRDKRDPDWSVGMKVAYHQGMYWVVDIERIQKKPKDVEDAVRACAKNDGYSCAIRMEKEPGSSGEITIDHYARNVVPGYDFVGLSSTGSKVDRARPASAAAQGGRIFIVNGCRNALPFRDELAVFPYGLHDDTIDGLSGAVNYFRRSSVMRAPTSIKKAGGSLWNSMRTNMPTWNL